MAVGGHSAAGVLRSHIVYDLLPQTAVERVGEAGVGIGMQGLVNAGVRWFF